MTRGQLRRRLAFEWWRWLAAALLPLVLLGMLFGAGSSGETLWQMPLFIAGLASMFPSLRLFTGYKHALIATGKALDGPDERAAWQQLASQRRRALLGACLPAWLAVAGLFAGLNPVALTLLAMSSLLLLCLYRIPRQLA